MDPVDLLGYIATGLNVIMLLPQVRHTWRSKDATGLSLAYLLISLTSCTLWFTYGALKAAPPVMASNLAIGGMNLILVAMKVRYK
jgi:MtN3 and saliva related transmembrane protein